MPWKAGESLLPVLIVEGSIIEGKLSQCPGKRASHCYGLNIKFLLFSFQSLNALESGRVIVTLSYKQPETIPAWNCLNALESGRVIVTKGGNKMPYANGLSQCPGKRASHCYPGYRKNGSGSPITCLNALESGRVIVTDPILEAGGSKAREPRIANPLS